MKKTNMNWKKAFAENNVGQAVMVFRAGTIVEGELKSFKGETIGLEVAGKSKRVKINLRTVTNMEVVPF